MRIYLIYIETDGVLQKFAALHGFKTKEKADEFVDEIKGKWQGLDSTIHIVECPIIESVSVKKVI